MRRTDLSVQQILAWADAFHARTGQWPGRKSGRIWEPPDEKWANIDTSLCQGLRGLQPWQSLARLLAKHRGKRNRKALPVYTIGQILGWADAHFARVQKWPQRTDGPIAVASGETWHAVDIALHHGRRGLPGSASLAQLLAANRGVRNNMARPRLTIRQVLAWADEHRRRTGNWPTEESGPIPQADGDTWVAVAMSLRNGLRGLQRSSLFQLLTKHRGVKRHVRRSPLTVDQVLGWCDEYHAWNGKWPKLTSGPIAGRADETWPRVNVALVEGKRGLPPGKSLAQLLAEHRGVRSRVSLPPLSTELILRWARAFKKQHGCWPNRRSGTIPVSGGETWGGVNGALERRGRGLQHRSTLARLLGSQR